MPNFSATYTTRAGQTRQLRLQAAYAASARRDLRRRGIVPSGLELVTQKAPGSGDAGSLIVARLGPKVNPAFNLGHLLPDHG